MAPAPARKDFLPRPPALTSPMAQLWGLDLRYKATGEYAATLQSPRGDELAAQAGREVPHPDTGEPCLAGDEPYLIAEKKSSPTSEWE